MPSTVNKFNQRRVATLSVSVGAVDSTLHTKQCSNEDLVIVCVTNPDLTQTLNFKFKKSIDNVTFMDAGDLRLTSVGPGESRLAVIEVAGTNFYQIVGSADGAGVASVPITVEHR